MKSLNIAYNPRIDQLRWLAATLVFLFHFNMEYRGLGGNGSAASCFGVLSEGHTGVGLFFTLSGFLFMQIAMHQEPWSTATSCATACCASRRCS